MDIHFITWFGVFTLVMIVMAFMVFVEVPR